MPPSRLSDPLNQQPTIQALNNGCGAEDKGERGRVRVPAGDAAGLKQVPLHPLHLRDRALALRLHLRQLPLHV